MMKIPPNALQKENYTSNIARLLQNADTKDWVHFTEKWDHEF